MSQPSPSPTLSSSTSSTFSSIARAVGRAFLDAGAAVLSPPRCAACDASVALRTIFCGACASTLEPLGPRIPAGCLAGYAFGGALAQAITRLKYEDRPDLARPLAEILRSVVRAAAPRVDLVCPVPLHPSKLAERGFNQSALLARPVARELGVPLAGLALARVRQTSRQASLPQAERHDNVVGAFEARTVRGLAGARVLLVDDVRTTGATLQACADAARAAGATEVTSLVLAVTL